MVNSKLKPDIDYNESKKLNVEDEGFEDLPHLLESAK